MTTKKQTRHSENVPIVTKDVLDIRSGDEFLSGLTLLLDKFALKEKGIEHPLARLLMSTKMSLDEYMASVLCPEETWDLELLKKLWPDVTVSLVEAQNAQAIMGHSHDGFRPLLLPNLIKKSGVEKVFREVREAGSGQSVLCSGVITR